jgi:hypothetical protein
MDDDNFDLSSLPSSVSLSSTYTPKSAEESPLDSPFGISPLQAPQQQPPEPRQQEEEDDDDEEELFLPKDKEKHVWVPIDDQWKKILMSEFYFVKDCAPDGNCQFRSLEEAIKSDSQIKASHKKLRRMVAEHILTLSDLQFQDILNNYKAEKDSGEFYGDWDPNAIKTKRQLALEIKKPGFNFEGDNMTLSILSKVLNVDIFIFNQNTHSITKIEKDNTNFIILNFIQSDNTGHYKTIGFKLGKDIQTLFDRNNLHEDMLALVDKNIFYTKHIQQVYELYEPFTCNDLSSNLELLLGKLSNYDKKLVCRLSAQFVSKTTPKPREKRKSVKKSKSPKTSKSKSVRKSKSKSKSVKRKSKSKSKSVKRKSKSKSKKSKSVRKSKSKSKSVKRKSKSKSKKSKSVRKSKSKSKKSKSVRKSKSKSKKSKSVRKSKSKSKKSKSVKRKSNSKSKKSKSVRKSKSKSKKSKSVRKSKSKSKKSKSVRKSKYKSKSVKRKSKYKSKSVKRKSKYKSKSVKRKSKYKSKSVKRKSKSVKKSRKTKKVKRAKLPKRKSKPMKP